MIGRHFSSFGRKFQNCACGHMQTLRMERRPRTLQRGLPSLSPRRGEHCVLPGSWQSMGMQRTFFIELRKGLVISASQTYLPTPAHPTLSIEHKNIYSIPVELGEFQERFGVVSGLLEPSPCVCVGVAYSCLSPGPQIL